jgi:hypothetical protein
LRKRLFLKCDGVPVRVECPLEAFLMLVSEIDFKRTGNGFSDRHVISLLALVIFVNRYLMASSVTGIPAVRPAPFGR